MEPRNIRNNDENKYFVDFIKPLDSCNIITLGKRRFLQILNNSCAVTKPNTTDKQKSLQLLTSFLQ